MEALEKEVTRLNKQLLGTGVAGKAAGKGAAAGAVGVKSLGAAVKTALGPIGAALAAVSGLGAAFNTLKGQDFSEAKFESLGGNADQLVTNLQAVSNELQGTASVAQLTAAAYDVASAGFSSAAEASAVLKAASQGATGGFAELNTVANATTSVLNAYGLGAADATKVVDQFIQTQNDGKIVVAEYAANIGKVASAAAGLGVPLSEVNAVIAQATASGVQADVAFTGLKGALARLASGEAAKALKDFGINIDAASIEADGLLGTLKKLEGLDTGTLFKALGTEAGPALLPVIQNLEKYEELLKNQESANGVAAAAAGTAAGTIEGAWSRVTVALENLFSDQSELGQIIRGTLLAAAATVEALATTFKLLMVPTRAVSQAFFEIAQALTGLQSGEQVLQTLTALWFQQLQRIQEVVDTIIAVGKVIGQYIGALVTTVKGWFSSLWTDIGNGASGVIEPIVKAFSDAFQFVQGLISNFVEGLPPWLKDALGGIGSGISGVLSKVMSDIEAAKKSVQSIVPGSTNASGPGPTAALGGGGGAGAAGSTEAQKLADQEARRLAAAKEMLAVAQAEIGIKQALTPVIEAQLQSAEQVRQIEREYAQAIQEATSAETIKVLETAKGVELQLEEVKLEQQLADIREGAVSGIESEIELLQAKIAGKEEEYLLAKKIKDLEAKGVDSGVATDLVNTQSELEKQLETQEKLKASAEQLASSIASGLTSSLRGLIDGSMSAEEAMTSAFKSIADSFLDMAMQMIQEWLKMQLLGIIGGALGGGGFGVTPATSGMSFFAEGGYVDSPTNETIGEAGESEYVIPASKMDGAMSRYSSGARGEAVLAGADSDSAPEGAAVAEAPMSINITGGVTQMGGNDYIRQDELPSIIGQASKAGEARALRRLRQSPSARRSIGL